MYIINHNYIQLADFFLGFASFVPSHRLLPTNIPMVELWWVSLWLVDAMETMA